MIPNTRRHRHRPRYRYRYRYRHRHRYRYRHRHRHRQHDISQELRTVHIETKDIGVLRVARSTYRRG